MQLLVITVVSEQEGAITAMLRAAGVAVFSRMDATGHKTDSYYELADSWFSAGIEPFTSTVFFTFTEAAIANNVVARITEFNLTLAGEFPARAFVLPVAYHS